MQGTDMTVYPLGNKDKDQSNPAIDIYGLRFHADQSLYEYLIEFLLVFVSAKDADCSGKMELHDYHPTNPTFYYVEPRNGFRRFIFFEKAKKSLIREDELAYQEIHRVLKKYVQGTDEKKNEFLYSVQELFRGYSAVLKKRTWCAQELLPMCPEMIFCEQMPNDRFRKNGPVSGWENKCGVELVRSSYDADDTFYDASFDLTRHNFLARGGEIYYLHLLQAMQGDMTKRGQLQKALVNLLTSKSAHFSKLANWIQDTWVKDRNLDPETLVKKLSMGYIPAGSYSWSGKSAVDELLTFLSNELHPVKRVELLAKGVVFQVLRMQLDRTAEYINEDKFPIIVDMRSRKGGTIIRQLSANSFNRISDAFVSAINQCILAKREAGVEPNKDNEFMMFAKAKKESLDIFRAKGKELQFIIPANGPFERFSLSEDLLRFLVLSLVAPGKKIDLNLFLKKLYENYRLVIGPNEYVQVSKDSNLDKGLINSFSYNLEAFQYFLKASGFLKDLSDATSIVVNPYEEVQQE